MHCRHARERWSVRARANCTLRHRRAIDSLYRLSRMRVAHDRAPASCPRASDPPERRPSAGAQAAGDANARRAIGRRTLDRAVGAEREPHTCRHASARRSVVRALSAAPQSEKKHCAGAVSSVTRRHHRGVDGGASARARAMPARGEHETLRTRGKQRRATQTKVGAVGWRRSWWVRPARARASRLATSRSTSSVAFPAQQAPQSVRGSEDTARGRATHWRGTRHGLASRGSEQATRHRGKRRTAQHSLDDGAPRKNKSQLCAKAQTHFLDPHPPPGLHKPEIYCKENFPCAATHERAYLLWSRVSRYSSWCQPA